MRNMKLGVIPARFQAPDLHPAHTALITRAIGENDDVLILLGCPKTGPTNHNPQDYKTRLQMIKGHYPQVMVAPLLDRNSDFTWSRELDEIVGSVAKDSDDVTLYCGRDGFKDHYHGRHKVIQIDSIPDYSGTSLREEARLHPIDSVDFRKGVIYGIGSKYPATFMTVDIAVRRGDYVMMARRPGSTHYRFPGGFLDFSDFSLEDACKRELLEETGLTVGDKRSFKYISTIPVDDWRYRGRPDARIMTALFMVDENDTNGDIVLDGDELEDHTFISINGDSMESVVYEHKPLFMELYRHVNGHMHGVSNPTKKKAN
jgi:ADP-ribose pyrophosphatase YjhB (NUDIX family)